MWIRLQDKEKTNINLDNIVHFRVDTGSNRLFFHHHNSSAVVCVYSSSSTMERDVARIENITNISIAKYE